MLPSRRLCETTFPALMLSILFLRQMLPASQLNDHRERDHQRYSRGVDIGENVPHDLLRGITSSLFRGTAERNHCARRSMFLIYCFPLDDFQVEHEYSVEHRHQQQFYESRDSEASYLRVA
jgi:hypothetical protein